MRVMRLTFFGMAFAVLCSLVGCGGGAPSAGAVTAPKPANLAGNWLLLGSLPSAHFAQSAPSASVSFDVNGTGMTGAGLLELPCTSGSGSVSVGFGADLTGAVASDGTFTIASPVSTGAATLLGLTLSGTAPSGAAGSWQGTYSVSGSPALCAIAGSGVFTATSIGDVSGSYAGSGTGFFFAQGNMQGTATQVSLGLSLQQGGTLYGLGETLAPYSRLALNGTIAVGGISCFSKGTTSKSADSLVEGSQFVAGFDMDDGSRVFVVGEVLLPDASQVSLVGLSVQGGNCDGNFVMGPSSLVLNR